MNKDRYTKEASLYDESEASLVFTETKQDKDVYHVLNFEPEGWAIVSADDVALG